MSERDQTDELLREYFRAQIDAIPERPAPVSTPLAERTHGAPLSWISRLAVAAPLLLALALPFTGGRSSASAELFATAHEHLRTREVLSSGLVAAHQVLSDVFGGRE